MKTQLKLPPLYPIIDSGFVKPEDVAKAAEEILKGGATIIQLRGKNISTKDFISMAKTVKTVTEAFNATFIINDRVDVAMVVGAEGVHLGQDDLPIKQARKLLGEEKIIGVSTHGVEEVTRAAQDGADYVGFGPIYETSTKSDTHDIQGLDKLKEIRKATDLPLVAIGGINRDNIGDVLSCGADSCAVISDILNNQETGGIKNAVKSLLKQL